MSDINLDYTVKRAIIGVRTAISIKVSQNRTLKGKSKIDELILFLREPCYGPVA